MRFIAGAPVGQQEIQEFRNVCDFKHVAHQSTTAYKRVEEALQSAIEDDLEGTVATLRLQIAQRALQLEAALPLIQELLNRMKSAAGAKALKQAAEPIKFIEDDGTVIPRPNAVA